MTLNGKTKGIPKYAESTVYLVRKPKLNHAISFSIKYVAITEFGVIENSKFSLRKIYEIVSNYEQLK